MRYPLKTIKYYSGIAKSLGEKYSVYIPEKQRRGLSLSANTDVYHAEKENDDLIALVKQTNARLIFGYNSGAIIALEASFKINPMSNKPSWQIQLLLSLTLISSIKKDAFDTLRVLAKEFEMGKNVN